VTDRIRHLTITLERDTRDDDLEPILLAIRLIRGVAIVEPHVVQASDHLARQVVRAEIQRQIHEAVEGVFHPRDLRERSKDL
jgi:hypothetical protein